MSNQSEAVFDALGEPVRRRIIELLRDGPHAVGQLAEQLPVGRPAVSKHLRVLGDAGLVRHVSRGTRNLYALAPPGLTAAQQWLVAMWDSALTSYAEAVRAELEQNVGGRRRPTQVAPTTDAKVTASRRASASKQAPAAKQAPASKGTPRRRSR